MRRDRLTIAVDLDGVLNEYKGWTGKYENYPAKPGARLFLKALSEYYRVVICTARMDLESVHNWLFENDMSEFVDEVTHEKVPALFYIDDRAITFNGDYNEVLNLIYTQKPYWEEKEKE